MTDATPLASEQITQEALGDLPSRIQGWIGKARGHGRDRIELDFKTVELLVRVATRRSAAPAPSDQDASQAQGEVLTPADIALAAYTQGYRDGCQDSGAQPDMECARDGWHDWLHDCAALKQGDAAPGATAQDGVEPSITEHDAYRLRLVAEADCAFRIPAPFDEVADHLATLAFDEGVKRAALSPATPGEEARALYEHEMQERGVTTPWSEVDADDRLGWQRAAKAVLSATPTPTIPAGMVTVPEGEEIARAIKATEYKYFGDYEMSDDQREAVDVLVRVAQHYANTKPEDLSTPSATPGALDPATVERKNLAERIRAAVTYQYMPMAVRKLLSEAAAALAAAPTPQAPVGQEVVPAKIAQTAVDAALDAEWLTDSGGDVPAAGQSYSIRDVMEEFGANLSTREIENAMHAALAAALNPPGGNEWAIAYDREGPR